MSKMIGLQSLLVLPIVVGPLALDATTPMVLGGNTLIPVTVLLVLAAAVFKAGGELQKIRTAIEKTDHLDARMTRVEGVLNLPPMPVPE